MQTSEAKDVLSAFYDDVNRGDRESLLARIADDVQWTIMGTTALSGTFRGKAEVIEKLFGALRARLSDGPPKFKVERVIAEGDIAIMQATGAATSRHGEPYNNNYCIVARVADGQLKEMTEYVDTELVTKVLGR